MSDFDRTLDSFVQRVGSSPDYPLDVEAFAASLGVVLMRVRSRETTHPQLVTSGLATAILLPQDHPERKILSARDRFSVAHELGHYVIWATHRYVPKSSEDYWHHEALCDRFAGRLLIPKFAVAQAIDRVGDDRRKWLGAAKVLARNSLVSWDVAAFRLSEEARSVFFFSAIRSKNRAGYPVWKVTGSTLDFGERQRLGKGTYLSLDSMEGRFLEELPQHHLACSLTDLRFPSVALLKAELVAYKKGNRIRFCAVSGLLQDTAAAAEACSA